MKLFASQNIDVGEMLPDAWIAFGFIQQISWFAPTKFEPYFALRLPHWRTEYSFLHDRQERLQTVLLWVSGRGWQRACAHC
jgi:hypothetical protein